jgi:hypothetical protein
MSTSDIHKYNILTLSAKVAIMKKLDKGENLLIQLKSMVLDVISGKIEKRLNICEKY